MAQNQELVDLELNEVSVKLVFSALFNFKKATQWIITGVSLTQRSSPKLKVQNDGQQNHLTHKYSTKSASTWECDNRSCKALHRIQVIRFVEKKYHFLASADNLRDS